MPTDRKWPGRSRHPELNNPGYFVNTNWNTTLQGCPLGLGHLLFGVPDPVLFPAGFGTINSSGLLTFVNGTRLFTYGKNASIFDSLGNERTSTKAQT